MVKSLSNFLKFDVLFCSFHGLPISYRGSCASWTFDPKHNYGNDLCVSQWRHNTLDNGPMGQGVSCQHYRYITKAICIVLYWDFSFIFEAIETTIPKQCLIFNKTITKLHTIWFNFSILFASTTDEAPQIPDEIEILSERGIQKIYEKGLEFMEGGVIYPLHISLKGTPLDSSGLPMVSIVTVSGDGSRWRRAPSWGVELDDLGKRSRSLHVKLHPAFSGDIHFDMRLNSGDQFVFTLKVHVFFFIHVEFIY